MTTTKRFEVLQGGRSSAWMGPQADSSEGGDKMSEQTRTQEAAIQRAAAQIAAEAQRPTIAEAEEMRQQLDQWIEGLRGGRSPVDHPVFWSLCEVGRRMGYWPSAPKLRVVR